VVDQVVIGTHGSLKNWVSKRILPLAAIRILVFDEADHMLQVLTPRLRVSSCYALIPRPVDRQDANAIVRRVAVCSRAARSPGHTTVCVQLPNNVDCC